MPVYYQFTDKKTKTGVDLRKIDELMCKDCGIPCHPEHWCDLFNAVTDIGTSSKIQTNGQVDETKLRNLLKKTDIEQPVVELLVKYLVGEYTFDSWWQQKL